MPAQEGFIKEFRMLGIDARIELVHRLWAEIGRDVPLHRWQREILEHRVAEADRDGELGQPWADVKRQLLPDR